MANKLARVLLTFFDGTTQLNPNDLVTGTAAVIKSFEKSGFVDSNDDAVKYVKSENAEAIEIHGKGMVINDDNSANKEALQKEIDALKADLKKADADTKSALEASIASKEAELAAL